MEGINICLVSILWTHANAKKKNTNNYKREHIHIQTRCSACNFFCYLFPEKKDSWNSSLTGHILNLIIWEDMKSAFQPPHIRTQNSSVCPFHVRENLLNETWWPWPSTFIKVLWLFAKHSHMHKYAHKGNIPREHQVTPHGYKEKAKNKCSAGKVGWMRRSF